jgi:hypothetical protein
MKVAVCLGMTFAFAGCVTGQEQTAAVTQCHSEKTPVEWMRCLNEPETRIAGETPLIAYRHVGQEQTQ